MTLNILQRKEKEQAAPVRETEKTQNGERARKKETQKLQIEDTLIYIYIYTHFY